jgi:sugar O-acyltransferase (sialic acid O-acetyltransferase NeuD family)
MTPASHHGSIPYVMFGHSALFGDYFDIIRLSGGELRKVVVNIIEPGPINSKYFAERLQNANRLLAQLNAGYSIAVEHIDQFTPNAGERYVIGFRGLQLCPLRDRLKSSFGTSIDSLVHPSAVISSSATIGEGAIIAAGCVIASCVELGDYSLVNRGACIGHDARIEEFANIGPGANLASGVRIERAAIVGIAATVLENIVIGTEALVAAGAVVTRNVEPGTVVAGVPARFVKNAKTSR